MIDSLVPLATLSPRRLAMAIGIAAASAVCVPAFAAQVDVTYVDPDHFTDASYSLPSTRGSEPSDVQHDFTEYFKRLGAKRLPADATLAIEVLDIDLAGRLSPTVNAGGDGIRIQRSFDWPRMKLRFVLSQGGRVVQSGEDTLTDMSYLDNVNRHQTTDRLRYEEEMIDRWFEKRFIER